MNITIVNYAGKAMDSVDNMIYKWSDLQVWFVFFLYFECEHTVIIHCLTTVLQTECFDEALPPERLAYSNYLTREGRGVTTMTHQMGYVHGRPLDVTTDENVLNRNFRPIYMWYIFVKKVITFSFFRS